MRSKVFITQALASLMRGPAESGHSMALPLRRAGKPLTALALSLCLLSGLIGLMDNFGFAAGKNVQISGIHYQPEGVVIQTIGGKSKTPSIETWPNMKDGVTTELVMIRIPNCDGDYAAMQQAALQEMAAHPEIKQFWVTAINNEKEVGKGLQIALEVVTSASKPEFTPDTLAQGDDQWIVTLQSTATQSTAAKLSNRSLLPENSAANGQALAQTSSQVGVQPASPQTDHTTPEPASDETSSQTHGWHRHKKTDRSAETETASATQDLLTALNEAKQKQAELGAQIVTLQRQLAESNTQKEALQSRLNGYENLLEETGVNPQDAQKEDKLIIQNLKNALVRVAQKLKTAEETLAKGNSKPTPKPGQPVHNLVDGQKEVTIPPVATLGMAEVPPQKKSVPTVAATSRTDTGKIASGASASNAITNVYQTSGKPPLNPANQATASPKTLATQKDETEARLQKAIQKNPIQVDNYLSLADHYVAKKDWKNAQSTLVNLTHVEPGGAQGYYYLTMIYLSLKDKKNAQTAMEQYIQHNPKDAKGIQTLKKAMQANSPTGTNAVNAVKSSQGAKPPLPISAKTTTTKTR